MAIESDTELPPNPIQRLYLSREEQVAALASAGALPQLTPSLVRELEAEGLVPVIPPVWTGTAQGLLDLKNKRSEALYNARLALKYRGYSVSDENGQPILGKDGKAIEIPARPNMVTTASMYAGESTPKRKHCTACGAIGALKGSRGKEVCAWGCPPVVEEASDAG